jgi:hypothetical protein
VSASSVEFTSTESAVRPAPRLPTALPERIKQTRTLFDDE